MRLKHRSSIPFALLMLSASLLAGCGENPNKKGVAQFEARQFEAAAQTFRAVLAKDKTNTEAIRNLVRVNIELLSDANLAETRALISSLRAAKREADVAEFDKVMEQKARSGALAGAPEFSRHLIDLFNTGEPDALPVIMKSALQNPAGFGETFKAMSRDKKDALVREALSRVTDNPRAVAALTHVVWRLAPSPANLSANVAAQRRLAHDRNEGSLEAAIKAVAELPDATKLSFYRDVHYGAGDQTPTLAVIGAYLEANHPAVFVEANIARLSVGKPNAQLLCSRRRIGAVTIVLRALEDGKPIAFEQVAAKPRASLNDAAGAYLDIVRKEAQEKPDRKYTTGPITQCLALFERLNQKLN